MKQTTLFFSGILLTLIVQLPFSTSRAAENLPATNYFENTHQTESHGDSEISVLTEQAQFAKTRYHDLQDNGSSGKVRQARQQLNSANQTLAQELSHRTGIPSQNLQEMHATGTAWETIVGNLIPDSAHGVQQFGKTRQTKRYGQDYLNHNQATGIMGADSNENDSSGGNASGGSNNSGGHGGGRM